MSTESAGSKQYKIDQLLASPPREPSKIRPTEHLLRRYSDEYGPGHETRRNPEITDAIIETCIREGDVRRGNGETIVYEALVDGHEWWVVVGFRGGPSAITAYVPGVHERAERDKRGGGR